MNPVVFFWANTKTAQSTINKKICKSRSLFSYYDKYYMLLLTHFHQHTLPKLLEILI